MRFLGLEASGSVAYVDATSGQRATFADVMERGRAIATTVSPPKQLVLHVAANDAFGVTAFWGLVDAGHAVALLDPRATDDTTADLVRTYRPSWVTGPQGLAVRLSACGLEPTGVEHLAGGELVRMPAPATAALDPALSVMLTTSGTTGSRKFVRLSRRNVEANAASIAEALGLSADERPIASLPLHYSFGLSVLDSHWLVGAPIVLTDDGVLQRSFWTTFDREGCTSLAGVPYTYQMLERVGFRDLDLPSLRSMQQAGGALDRHLTEVYRDHMRARGGRFFVMYGQTEATARIACVPPDRLVDRLGSAGLAIPGGRLTIEPLADEPEASGPGGASTTAASRVEPRAHPVGEVIYEGPNVMLGYASIAEDLARGDELGGVLRTGDIGYLDDEGFLFLVGRSKRIAKVFGHRINLDEVERMVRDHGPAAVVGGADSIWAFCAFGTDEAVEALGRDIATRLRIHHSAVHARRVDAIPASASGKLDYATVQGWVG